MLYIYIIELAKPYASCYMLWVFRTSFSKSVEMAMWHLVEPLGVRTASAKRLSCFATAALAQWGEEGNIGAKFHGYEI